MAIDPGVGVRIVAMPCWEEDTLEVECPDSGHLVTMTLQRFTRN